MTSQRDTLKAFTDAAADAVARAIASVHREATREREVRDAEFRARFAEFEARMMSVVALERQLSERLASLKDGEQGPQGERGEPGEQGPVGESGDTGPKGEPGEAGERGEPGIPGEPGKDGEDGERGLPGERGEQGVGIRGIAIDESGVASVVLTDGREIDLGNLRGPKGDAGPKGEDGSPGHDGADGRDGRDGTDGRDGAQGPAGPQGKMPIVREWEDGVHYEGDVLSLDGSTYQAVRDTGKQPPHDDWICIAKAGAPGASFNIRGTWLSDGTYKALDVVALNGGSFVAKRDDPGVCPGDGWQLMSAQGKSGRPGERGPQGEKGERGEPGLPVVAVDVNEEGVLTLTNGDGSTVTCDLYEVLVRIAQ